jgi:hypothetical protein
MATTETPLASSDKLLCKSTGKPVEKFSTGSIRDNQEGKGRFDLVTPEGLRRVAIRYEAGAIKYGEHNWQKGQPVNRTLNSAIRHIFQYLAGMRDEDHLGAAAWNVLAAMHLEKETVEGRLPAELLSGVQPRNEEEFEKYLQSLGYWTAEHGTPART